jgi:tetratricopeptide (TPR) repeat protein
MKRKSTFIILTIIMPIYLSSQSISITTTSQQAKTAFTEARERAHLVWMSGGIEKMEKAVELDSTLAIGHAYLAVMIKPFLARDNSRAIANAKKYAPQASDGEQLMIAGWLGFAGQDWGKAISNWEKLLHKYPDDPYTRHILGDAYRIKKRFDDAIKTLKGLVNRPKPFVPAYNHLAYSYLQINKMDSAYATIQKFVAANPKNANAYDSMADIVLEKGNTQAAIAYLQRAVLADDRFASAQNRIGDLLLENNEPFLARKAYEKAIAMSTLYGESFRKNIRKKIAEIEKPN